VLCGRLHVSDNGLPAIIDVDVLDPNVLMAAMPKPSKDLDLCRIGPQKPCRGRSKGCDPSLGPKSTPQPGQDRHCGRMRACHLNSQSCLHLDDLRRGNTGGNVPEESLMLTGDVAANPRWRDGWRW
jgi:hypothetical protein